MYVGNGKEMEINRKEVFRYLGYKNEEPDQETLSTIEACIEEVYGKGTPRSVFRRYAIQRDGAHKEAIEGNPSIRIKDMVFLSSHLSKNLKGCQEVILFAATLGPAIDRLMTRYSKTQISKAACLQAVAAAAIESYCDSCQKEIEEELEKENLFLRPPFSPGYGDLSLKVQKEILTLLDAEKRIGIYLTEGNVMLPEKSITAIMGISRENRHCLRAGCEVCEKLDCEFRRDSL